MSAPPVTDLNISSVKMDELGMAKDATLKKLFAEAHLKSPALQTKFGELYTEVTGKAMRQADFHRIFGQVMFTKTLLVSNETLTSQQAGINWLALMTGVWLQDADTLYSDAGMEEQWKEAIFTYLAKLYDAMDSKKSAQEMHKAMAVHTKALKKSSLRRWISFLDNNKLRAVSPQNQKCLWAPR